jgi:hypothetical protein
MAEKWQVCQTDQYGSTTILSNEPELDGAITKIKKAVHDENMENALTGDEKLKNWEFFTAETAGGNFVFAGRDNKGRPCFFLKESPTEFVLAENVDTDIRFYLGEELTRERDAVTKRAKTQAVFALDERRQNEVGRFDDRALMGKGFFFIRKA